MIHLSPANMLQCIDLTLAGFAANYHLRTHQATNLERFRGPYRASVDTYVAIFYTVREGK
jgi:hypothetical protein